MQGMARKLVSDNYNQFKVRRPIFEFSTNIFFVKTRPLLSEKVDENSRKNTFLCSSSRPKYPYKHKKGHDRFLPSDLTVLSAYMALNSFLKITISDYKRRSSVTTHRPLLFTFYKVLQITHTTICVSRGSHFLHQ